MVYEHLLRPMIVNYASEIEQKATILIDDSEVEDWPALVNNLRKEKLKLTQSLSVMMAEKESLALSLDNNHEDKIQRIVQLEDKIAELLLNAAKNEKEISDLKQKLEQNQTEDAYRQTIAEADSLLSKMEADYQETIKNLQHEKSVLEEQVRLLEQSQGYLKNQLAKVLDDTERKEEIADLAERLLGTLPCPAPYILCPKIDLSSCQVS